MVCHDDDLVAQIDLTRLKVTQELPVQQWATQKPLTYSVIAMMQHKLQVIYEKGEKEKKPRQNS